MQAAIEAWARKDRPAPNVDTYLCGFDSNGPEAASVYQCELNVLINHYTAMAKEEELYMTGKKKESLSLIIMEERLAYWQELQRKTWKEQWWEVKTDRAIANKKA